jgi:hypothetical protein
MAAEFLGDRQHFRTILGHILELMNLPMYVFDGSVRLKAMHDTSPDTTLLLMCFSAFFAFTSQLNTLLVRNRIYAQTYVCESTVYGQVYE